MSVTQNNTLHMKFSEFYLWFHNSCKIYIYSLGLPLEIVFGVIIITIIIIIIITLFIYLSIPELTALYDVKRGKNEIIYIS